MEQRHTEIQSLNASVEKMRASCLFDNKKREKAPSGPRQIRLVRVKHQIAEYERG